MRLTRPAVALALLLLYVSAAAGGPARHEAVYEGRIGIVPVRVAVRLLPDGDSVWRYESDARTRGWAAWKSGRIEEVSRFAQDAGRIRPIEYLKRDGFSEKDRNIVSRFDDEGVVSVYRGQELRHVLPAPAYDLLSLRLQLALDLAGDRLDDRYRIVDGKGRLRTIDVRRLGEDGVDTGLGPHTAVKLEYDTGDDRRYAMWLAPKLGYELVRFEQYKRGRLRARLILSQYTQSD